MKARTITARYPHIFHLEAILQEAIDAVKTIPLPPIEQPHIFHYLLSKMSGGNVFVVVEDSKPVGFGVVDGTTYPWNTQRLMAVGFMVVRNLPHEHVIEIEELLLREMIGHSYRNNVSFSPLRMPGLRMLTSPEDLHKMGATIDDGTATFLLPSGMENQLN